ncbi:hypothetical protein FOB72_24050 [Cupriavidus pauculus]|jgi:hypothetical protein|uniref:BON domain-containing protein n=1 Tax=Cupriavidus pauculus TaxID=82633 RepID=A0A5P2HA69_9BURK|nr:hypothetical protein [Cupriavidus pauculus]QET05117.1 hypothetical protein FOB72_24050 [Cupriavidus pauculus]
MQKNRIAPPLTDFHYGGHSGVNDEKSRPERPVRAADDPAPGSHTNLPKQPYRPQPGSNEPAGVERYGMYGVAPGSDKLPPEFAQSGQRPLPGPAALGQFDGDDMRPLEPLNDAQRLEVLHERLSMVVDPGIISIDMIDGAVTLRGTVRDAPTRKAVENIVMGCLTDHYVRSEIDVAATR